MKIFFTSGTNEVRYLGYVSMYKNKTNHAMPVTTNIGGMCAYCVCHGKREALLYLNMLIIQFLHFSPLRYVLMKSPLYPLPFKFPSLET